MKRRLFPAVFAAMALLLVSLTGRGTAQAATQYTDPRNGVICETGDGNGNFDLTATIGYALMSDGNAIHMWGYALGSYTDLGVAADHYQYPGPILCVNQGTTVSITLHNLLPEDTSLIFPGQENVLVDGQPAQPVFAAGAMTSLTQAAVAAPYYGAPGGSATYSFVAGEPGTYVYESGTNAGSQVQMGMFGVIIVRPSGQFAYNYNYTGNRATDEGQVAYAYDRPDSIFNPAHEHVEVLSEIDPFMHQAYETDFINWTQGQAHNIQPFDMKSYVPRYFLLNGRTFPDTMADNNAPWLPNQPYSALVHIYPYDPANNPHPALVRYVGFGTKDYPFHPHGNDSLVIGRDGRPLVNASGADLSMYKFSIPIGPGQTWDITFDWRDDNNYSASQPVPVQLPQTSNMTIGPYWSGSPYLGTAGNLPPGGEGYSQCGEYYHIAHNHALQQMTSWGGITLSGQATYTRIDPPLPNNCP